MSFFFNQLGTYQFSVFFLVNLARIPLVNILQITDIHVLHRYKCMSNLINLYFINYKIDYNL